MAAEAAEAAEAAAETGAADALALPQPQWEGAGKEAEGWEVAEAHEGLQLVLGARLLHPAVEEVRL